MMKYTIIYVLSLTREVYGLAPEKGDALPAFPKSFPGCSCKWASSWTCEGNAVFPKAVQGDACCCCGVQCSKSNRCSNEACLSIGVDQKAELAAEQKRMDELLKGADMLIGDSLPAFAVDLGPGQCTKSKILQKCQEKGLTPLCDHTSYSNTNQCYTPGKTANKFFNRHFSHYSGHRALMGLDPSQDAMFYGMCFFAHNGDWALAPSGASHAWTNGNSATNGWLGGDKNFPKNVKPTFNQMNQCLPKDQKGLGCWRTLCVKEQPNR